MSEQEKRKKISHIALCILEIPNMLSCIMQTHPAHSWQSHSKEADGVVGGIWQHIMFEKKWGGLQQQKAINISLSVA